MTIRVTNTALLKTLIANLGERGQALLEIGADISRSTIRDMLRGAVPGDLTRSKVAAFFEIDESELFPLIVPGNKAA